MSGYVLGLDGGGTKVVAQLATSDGVVLEEATAGPCNIAAMPVADALANALQACDTLLAQHNLQPQDIRAVCAGVAGVSVVTRRAEFLAGLQSYFSCAIVTVEPDYAVAFTGATDGAPGVIVIAGTGSVAYGENADGLSHKTGAYGYLIDDAGSGYGVGRMALAAVLRAADGTGEPTTLTERVCAALQIASVLDIVPGVYGSLIDRVTIASLAHVVAKAAVEDSDPVAQTILANAADALAQLVLGVTKKLFIGATSYPIVRIGSLWHAGPPLTDSFHRAVTQFAPNATIAEPAHSPVHGAVIQAIAALSAI